VQLDFAWSAQGSLLVDATPRDEVIISFVGWDVGPDPDRARELRRRLAAAVAGGAQRSSGPHVVGRACAITVHGSTAEIENLVELFPVATYPVSTLLDALAQLEAWLVENLHRRPGYW